MTRVNVQYFAILREQRGLTAEVIETSNPTVAGLYEELRSRHGFTLPGERVRAAVNDTFVPASQVVREGDRVVFIPPVAGG